MDRLEEPPFVSLEDRAGGPFTGGAEDPGDGRGGCGCASAGCVLAFAGAVLITCGAAYLLLAAPGRGGGAAGERASAVERRAADERATERAPLAARPAEVRPGRTVERVEVEAEAAPATPLGAARLLERKLSRVRAITMPVLARARDGRLRYLGWCDEATGPTGTEPLHHGPYRLNAVERMAQDLAKEVASAPSLPPLEAAIRRFAQAAQACAAVLEEADAYYAEERWMADGFQGGRALHPRLTASWRALANADLLLEAERAALLSDAEATILAAIIDDPQRTSEVRLRRAFAAARAVDGAVRPPIQDPGEEDSARIAAVKALGETLDAAVAALADPLPAGAAPVVGTQAFQGVARSLGQAAKALALRHEARTAFTAEERKALRGQGAPSVLGGAPRVASFYAQVEAAWIRLRFD